VTGGTRKNAAPREGDSRPDPRLSLSRERPANLIHQAEFEEVVGAENICENVQSALRRAKRVHDQLEADAIGRKS
jgi:hypothetical protein